MSASSSFARVVAASFLFVGVVSAAHAAITGNTLTTNSLTQNSLSQNGLLTSGTLHELNGVQVEFVVVPEGKTR